MSSLTGDIGRQAFFLLLSGCVGGRAVSAAAPIQARVVGVMGRGSRPRSRGQSCRRHGARWQRPPPLMKKLDKRAGKCGSCAGVGVGLDGEAAEMAAARA